MNSFNEYCREVGYDRNADFPQKVYNWYAYKSGGVFGPFSTEKEAKEVSKNTERVITPESEKNYNEFSVKQAELEKKAFDLWYKDLRAEYSDLNDELFNIVYSEAYERGHGAGYDEVAMYVSDYADFVKRAINVK